MAGVGLGLAGCSKDKLPTDEFQILGDTSKTRAEALAAAKVQCEAETRKRGIKSVVSIFSRLRPGSAERDFRNCMQDKGFNPDADPADVAAGTVTGYAEN
ncbi:hypothetical protein V6C03_14150 [Methyloligella sp. 2.7D]|uniref:hypothetical protein n=1 Tax=unclassified Methyloligella TaxID=2625955 RepID=UPI00157CE229|nr:hypothetical protein [Methyloligella sp. GL2]QKP77102.1 hypothetical protein HT051_06315 [Methyloligella sp. GL2]